MDGRLFFFLAANDFAFLTASIRSWTLPENFFSVLDDDSDDEEEDLGRDFSTVESSLVSCDTDVDADDDGGSDDTSFCTFSTAGAGSTTLGDVGDVIAIFLSF